jgi:hypothetical protein
MSIKDEQILLVSNREWEGTVLPDLDPKRQGRYRVHIPQLMDQMEEHEGIWCRNHMAGAKLGQSNRGSYGAYTPLQPGTKVNVTFRINSLNAGYITKKVPDTEPNTNIDGPEWSEKNVNESTFDRDEQYVIMKTPKRYQIMYMNEDTSNDPNTIFIVFNRDQGAKSGRTITKYSEDGLHNYSRNNVRLRALQDETNQIDCNQTTKIGGKRKTSIATADHLEVSDKRIIKIGNYKHETIGQNYFLEAGEEIHIHAKRIILKGDEYICLESPVIAYNIGAQNQELETPEPTPIVPQLEE